ncbi:MAG: EAL domain-containing protein [Nakamurella sp.]
MNGVVAFLAFVVAAEYLVIAVDIVPRLARIAHVDREIVLSARWGATCFFLGCAITHVFIGLQAVLPALGGAMDMATGGSAAAMTWGMGLPHVAQILGGAVFIGISRSRLEVSITSKEEASAARDLDHQLRWAMDNAPVGIAFAAAAKQPRYANSAYRDILGFASAGAVSIEVDVLEVVHPADRHIGVAAMERTQAGEPGDVEFRVVRPGGTVRWLRLRWSQMMSSAHPRVTTIVEDVTDRVTAESALAASELRFTQLASCISVGISHRQLQPPQFLWANAAYKEIVGINPAQETSTATDPAVALIHPDDRHAVMTRYWPRAQAGLVAQSEHRVLRPDGKVRWVRVTSNPVPDDDGGVNRVTATVEDITADKAFEAVVADERRRLRQAESIGRVGSWGRDLESGASNWSAGVFELFGLDSDDADGLRSRIRALIHPEDLVRLDTAAAACVSAGVPFQVRYRIHRANDGALRWMNARGEAGYRDGKCVWIGGSIADVTAQVAAEAAAVAAQSFQQAIFSASPDIISVWDFTTEAVTWANRSIGADLGYSPPEVAAIEHQERRILCHPDDQARVDETLAAARDSRDDRVFQVDYRMQQKDGTSRWFSLRTAPLNRDEKGRVNQIVNVIRDTTDAMATELELRHSALHDSLTGLPNRTLLIDRIESALARADREDTEVGILFCDLDGFKRVNDTGGHAAGDAVLVEVSERLRRSIRRSDSVARVGGDEFVIILEPSRPTRPALPEPRHGHDQNSAENVDETPADTLTMQEVAELAAGRIRAAIVAPVQHDDQAYSVSVSIGMTFAGRGSVADDVLRDADSAMYLAKQRGRDRFEIFDELSREEAARLAVVERALRNALGPEAQRQARLRVAFQPMFDLTDGHLVGFEALARLTSADGTSIPPDAFIPVAENTGMISGLGATVLDLGLAGLAQWRADHADAVPATLAVNLSARQAHQSDLHDLVIGTLAKYGLGPADLTLELTESILLDTGSAGMLQLSVLHDAGVGIAIDDFGTGYASLRYLTTLPISSVKVDRSFTAGLPTDETDATIVRAIAGLAAELGLTCVVEGIETTSQLAALPAGVLGQGYLLGRPTLEPADVAPWSPFRRPEQQSTTNGASAGTDQAGLKVLRAAAAR